MIDVLLTVPHAYCVSVDERDCDIISKNVSLLLEKKLKEKKLKIERIVSDTLRSECDLNRKRCRDHPFRKKVSEMLKKRVKLLLDIHSFPERRKDPLTEMYILTNKTNRKLGENLLEYITAHKVNSFISLGSSYEEKQSEETNDIMDEGTENKVPSLLLEFKENLEVNRLEEIVDIVSDWVEITLDKETIDNIVFLVDKDKQYHGIIFLKENKIIIDEHTQKEKYKVHRNIMWHTHSLTEKGYPSEQDIFKGFETQGITHSLILTKWGLWEVLYPSNFIFKDTKKKYLEFLKHNLDQLTEDEKKISILTKKIERKFKGLKIKFTPIRKIKDEYVLTTT